ncbi:MAG: FAD-binding oxidoreductase [Candidatus Binataceae bacterium]
MIDVTAIATLREALTGTLVTATDTGYEHSRRVWNAMIDRRPELIVRCAGTEDIHRAVDFAHAHDAALAIRGGGHNIAGLGVSDGGIVIDLSLMKAISVDPARRAARAQAGVLGGELDRAAQAFGLATPLGQISTTGIAGLTLGGGMSWLHGKFGLACDNLLAVDIVTADGRALVASAEENSDLFWAVRGGGGNFGVVTDFEYRLHPLGRDLAGTVIYPREKARDMMRLYRELNATAPDGMLACAAFVTPPGGPLSFAIALDWCGELATGEHLLEPIRRAHQPVADMIRAMTHVEVQTMMDESAPPGLQNYWKATYLNGLSDDAIEVITEYAARATSPRTLIMLMPLRGAMSRVADNATAFPNRASAFTLNIMAMWTDGPATNHVRWAREFFAAMQPFSSGGVYVNDLNQDEGDDRVRAAYAANYGRLAVIKAKYDPDNFFHRNQNIRPAASSPKT